MTRGRNERKRTHRRIRKELRWWNEECPTSIGGHLPAAYSQRAPASTVPRVGQEATCSGCGRLIERDVTAHPSKDKRFQGTITTSPWRTRPFVIEELP